MAYRIGTAILSSVDEARVAAALAGLRRLGSRGAARGAEHLEAAAALAKARSLRWTEVMCYSLRESLNEIPPLYGQVQVARPLGSMARQFVTELSDAVAINAPPNILLGLVTTFRDQLDVAESERRFRIAQAMMAQAGAGMASRQVDAFATEWTTVVEGVNKILHGDEHSEEEALQLAGRAVDLMAALVAPLSNRLDEVDKYVQTASPSEVDVLRLLDLLADDRLARYFFAGANSAEWLVALDKKGLYAVPIQGDFYQGALLVRAGPQVPDTAKVIATRIARDPHAAASYFVLGTVAELGSDATDLAVLVLQAPRFQDPFRVARALEDLIERFAARGETAAFPLLADAALEPQRVGMSSRISAKFPEFEVGRLVRLFVSASECSSLVRLATVLSFKLRRAIGLIEGRASMISFSRSRIGDDEEYDRDAANALISGVRDSLRRLRDCRFELSVRAAALGELDNEVMGRIWAGHLAEEEEAEVGS